MKIKTNVIHDYFLIIVLVLFYVTEGLNKSFIFSYHNNLPFVKIIKGFITLFALTTIFTKKGSNKTVLMYIVLLTIIFVIGQINLNPNFDLISTTNFLRYLFPIILFVYVNNFQKDYHKKHLLFSIYENVILINSILIICGFVFGVHIFETYPGLRFGYNGLLVTSATSTYFYTIAMFYYVIKYRASIFNSIPRIVVMVSVFLIGTKSLYLFMVIFAFIYALLFTQRKVKLMLFSTACIIFVSFCYFFVIKKMSQTNDFLGSITSYRTNILTDETIPFIKENWSLQNYFFGGINDIVTRPQMAFFDMLYFIGIFGSFIYLKSYIKSYFNFKTTPIQMTFFILIAAIAFVSGNFFINTSVVIYLLIIRELLNQRTGDLVN